MSIARSFSAALPLLLLAACLGSDTSVGPPALIQIVDGAGQTAQVGRAVGTPPSVRVLDDNSNPVPDTDVLFTADAGFGSVTGAIATTDSAGVATVGSWTLGSVVGEQRLTAKIQSLDVLVQIPATATAGPPAGIVAIAPLQFAGLAGSQVSPLPTVYVTDSYGNAQVGAQVTFTVLFGGGSVGGSVATTGSDGRASVGSWTLGVTAGTNRLEARIASGARVTFDAQGLASAPTQLIATSETSQSGTLGFQVAKTPRVLVKDANGTILPNIPVTFSVVGGGDATISGASAVSGNDGIAALGDWKLGSVTTTSTVQASLPGFPGPVATFTASGVAKPFVIDLRLLTTMLPNYRDALVAAASRWMTVVTGSLSPVTIDLDDPEACGPGSPAFHGSVPNMIIFVQVTAIDGVNGIIASAGPCVRRIPSYSTAIGNMRLDSSDLAAMDATGRLFSVVLHEMGHVIGFGTSWSEKGLVNGYGGSNPVFIGTNALALWPSFTMGYSGTPLPIETEGGTGTRDAHWRKTVFGPELMTGYLEPAGTPMPMSKLTIAVLQDLGYTVSFASAESYRGNLMANMSSSGTSIPLNETLEPAQFTVSADGTLQRTPASLFQRP